MARERLHHPKPLAPLLLGDRVAKVGDSRTMLVVDVDIEHGENLQVWVTCAWAPKPSRPDITYERVFRRSALVLIQRPARSAA